MSLHGDASNRERRLGPGLAVVLLVSSALVAALLLVAQAPRAGARNGASITLFGPSKPVGEGTARTYFITENGLPIEIGFEFTEDALQGLPATAPAHPGHHMMIEHLLDLPQEALSATPFKFLELDWNPRGHVPDGVYSRPHFDFHFFTITRAERDAIDPADPAFLTKAGRLPRPEFIPAGYILPQPLDAVPFMGVHWVAEHAAEFHGEPFTQTLIRGSWDGRTTFYEPMISKAYLESKPDVTLPIAPANCYQPAGYHPASYSIRYDAAQRLYRVSLGQFRYGGSEVLKTALQPSHAH